MWYRERRRKKDVAAPGFEFDGISRVPDLLAHRHLALSKALAGAVHSLRG